VEQSAAVGGKDVIAGTVEFYVERERKLRERDKPGPADTVWRPERRPRRSPKNTLLWEKSIVRKAATVAGRRFEMDSSSCTDYEFVEGKRKLTAKANKEVKTCVST